ncbi:MAG: TetR/AcrR family transcriptional regulator [Actinomycetota bacterium]|nr:TetR/AcrR family transcriptional regulator [Actinomycetota bacterium]
MNESAPRRARDRARAELTSEITTVARAHLAAGGASGLSLRAVARDLGMVSSALYRYFPSRDALLTALIVDAYNALADACEAAEQACARDDHLGRFRAVAHSARAWAVEHPHEYALLYGTPVHGYAAPDDTIDPATRVTLLLTRILADVDLLGPATTVTAPIDDSLHGQLVTLLEVAGVEIGHQRLLAGIAAWTNLFGMISFELFGHFKNVFDDADALFAHQTDRAASTLGLR